MTMKTFSEAEIQSVFEALNIETEEKRTALCFTPYSGVAAQVPIQVVSRQSNERQQG